jgi:hypothetical protein
LRTQEKIQGLGKIQNDYRMQVINGLEIELARSVKSPLPLFAKEGESLPLAKGGVEGFSDSVLINMRP